MNALSLVDKQKEEELRVYSNLYSLLSYEKVTFNGNSELNFNFFFISVKFIKKFKSLNTYFHEFRYILIYFI